MSRPVIPDILVNISLTKTSQSINLAYEFCQNVTMDVGEKEKGRGLSGNKLLAIKQLQNIMNGIR